MVPPPWLGRKDPEPPGLKDDPGLGRDDPDPSGPKLVPPPENGRSGKLLLNCLPSVVPRVRLLNRPGSIASTSRETFSTGSA